MRANSMRGERASLAVNFVGGTHGNCSRAGSPDALAEEAHLLSAIRSAYRFRHLHEKLADLRSELGDCAALRAGEVVPDSACVFWRAGYGAGCAAVLEPAAR